MIKAEALRQQPPYILLQDFYLAAQSGQPALHRQLSSFREALDGEIPMPGRAIPDWLALTLFSLRTIAYKDLSYMDKDYDPFRYICTQRVANCLMGLLSEYTPYSRPDDIDQQADRSTE